MQVSGSPEVEKGLEVPGLRAAKHQVRIRLLRVTAAGVVDKYGPVAAQWEGTCVCGWRCLCWSWGDPWRGALPVSLDHLEQR